MNKVNIRLPFRYSIFLTILLQLVSSCMSTMPSAKNSAKSYYESYFLENREEQIFIKPILFKAKTDRLLIDFTIRTYQDSCITNFTVLSPLKIEKPDSVFIRNNQFSFQLAEINKLYFDRIKTNYKTRFTSKLAVSELLKLMQNEIWDMKLIFGAHIEVFKGRLINKKKILMLNPILKELIIPEINE